MKIIFEFSGGPRDGQCDLGDTNESYSGGPFIPAVAYYSHTKNGTVGSRFMGLTPHALNLANEIGWEAAGESGEARAEKYEVTDRLEDGNEVLVRCKFIGWAY